MTSRRPFINFRGALSVLFLSSIAVYLYCSRQDTFSTLSMADHDSAAVLSKLVVSVRQADKSPPTFTLKVTNTGSGPVTILTWESPLDALALQLGLLSITPSGAAAPLDLPTIQVRRKTPPDEDQLVTLEAGESQEREIVIKEQVVPISDLAGDGKGKGTIKCKGRWMSVWPVKRDGVTDHEIELQGMGDEALNGDFESESVVFDM